MAFGALTITAAESPTSTAGTDAIVACGGGGAATKTYIGPSGGLWSAAGNWNPAGIPGAADIVCVPAGTSVNHNSGTTNIRSIEVLGTLSVTGGDLNLTDAAQESKIMNLTLSATLGGAGDILIPPGGTFTFNSGLVTSTPLDPGALTVAAASGPDPAGVINMNTGADHQFGGGRVVQNNGVVNMNNGYVGLERAVGATGAINNAGTFNLAHGSAESGYYLYPFGTTTGTVEPEFRNLAAGSLTKSGAAALTYFNNLRFDNDGTVQVNDGTLRVSSVGLAPGDAGSYGVAAGKLLEFQDSRTIAGSISGAGTVHFFGGTQTLTGSYTAEQTIVAGGVVSFNMSAVTLKTTTFTSGTITGPANITVPAGGTWNWTSGTITTTNPATPGTLLLSAAVGLTPAAVMNLNSAADRSIGGGRIVQNNGTINFNQGYISFERVVGGMTTLNNAGTFNVLHGAGDTGYYMYAYGTTTGTTEPQFNNLSGSTFTKSGAAALTYFNNLRFDNDGTVQVNDGTLRISGAGVGAGDAGSYGAATGKTLDFQDTRTINGPIAAANGNVIFSGGNVVVNGTYAAGATTVSGGTVTFNNATTTTNTWTQSGGTAALNFPSITFQTVSMSGGTLTGPVDITIPAGGTYTWTSGTLSSTPADAGTLTLSAAAVMNLNTNADRSIGGGRIVHNHGTINWNGGYISMERVPPPARTRIENNGTFDIKHAAADTGYYAYAYGTTTGNNEPVLHNISSTSLVKSGAAALTYFNSLAVNNDGALTVQQGELALNEGSQGLSSGTYTAQAGTTLRFGGGTHDIGVDGPATSLITGAGTVNFQGGVTNVTGDYSVTGVTNINGGRVNFSGGSNAAATTLNLSSGALGGVGIIDISLLMRWTGGTMDGIGFTSILPGALLDLDGNAHRYLESGRTLYNGGNVRWGGTAGFTVGGGTPSGATFYNDEGALFEITSNDQMYFGTGGTLVNRGIIRKSVPINGGWVGNYNAEGTVGAADSTTDAGPPANWTRGGAGGAGKFTTVQYGAAGGFPTPGHSISIGGSTNFFAGGPTDTANPVTLTQTVGLSGEAHTAADGGELTVFLDGYLGGKLTEGDNAKVDAIFLDGASNPIGTPLTIGPVTAAQRSNLTQLLYREGSVVAPVGTRSVRVVVTATRVGAPGYNDGYADNIRLRVRNGNAVLGTSIIDVPTDNDPGPGTTGGIVEAVEGSLLFQRGSVPSGGGHDASIGTFDAKGPANPTLPSSKHGGSIGFSGGTYVLDPAATVTGQGSIRVTGGITESKASWNVNRTHVSGGTINFTKTGAGDVAPMMTTKLLQTGGVIGGDDTVVADTFDWTDGSQYTGTTRVKLGGTWSTTGAKFIIRGRHVINEATSVDTIRWTGGPIYIGEQTGVRGAELRNEGVFEIRSDDNFYHYGEGTSTTVEKVHNLPGGVVKKTTTAGTTIVNGNVSFENDGTLDVQTGTLTLNGGGGSSSGTYDADAGAELAFGGQTHDLEPASVVTAAGTLRVSGGIANIGSGVYNVTGTTNVTGGTANFNKTGAGDVLPATTTVLSQTGGIVAGDDTLQSGTFNWTDGSQYGPGTTSVTDGGSWSGAGAKFIVRGRKVVNEATSNAITWTDGDIYIGSQTGVPGSELQNNGVFDVRSNRNLYHYNEGVSTTPQRVHNLAGGVLKKTTAAAGTTLLNSGVDFVNEGLVKTEVGTIQYSGRFTNSGTAEVGAGTLMTTPGATDFTNYNSTTKTITGGTYLIAGAFRFAGADIVNNAAHITLDGTPSALTDTAVTPLSGLRSFAKTTPAGSFTLKNDRDLTTPGAFLNEGMLNVASSNSIFQATTALTNAASTGLVKGVGTVQANVTNHGTFAPGLSPGILTVDGNYTQSSTGKLEIEVAGASTAGTDYDRLVVTGTASLDGTLAGIALGGFVPALGTGIDVVTAPIRSGVFSAVTSTPSPLTGNVYFQGRYQPTLVKLFVTPNVSAVDPASITEGTGSGSTIVNVPVTLSAASTEVIQVSYATANGTAAAGSDYTATSATLTFNPGGALTQNVPVTITRDGIDEPDSENFFLNLSAPVNTIIGDGQATIAILDDDLATASPTAEDKSVTTPEDTAIPITLVATDPNGDPLTYSIVGNPTNGTLGALVGNAVTYTPNANFNGADSFTFKANDGANDSNTATVTITVTPVNDNPSAVADSKTTAEDTPLTFPASELTTNDSAGPANESSQTLTVTAVSGPVNGTVSLVAGNITFTPSSDFNGAASFAYTATDNGTTNGAADPKTANGVVNVNITPVNDAPVAVDDAKSTAEDAALTFPAADLIGNDAKGPANEAGQTLAVTAVGNAVGGAVGLAGGNVTFTPAADYNGIASFEYTVTDNGTTNGAADPKSDVGAVAITISEVNDAPAAATDAKTTGEDTATSFAATDLLANDSKGPANESGQTLTVLSVQGAVGGTVSLVSGTITFTPASNHTGPASFTYTIRDNGTTNGAPDFNQATGTVNVTITPANDAPVAANDNYSSGENTTLNVPAPGLLGNDTDIDTPPANLSALEVTDPANGSVTVNANGSFSYTPDTGFNGPDTFTYKANDGALDSNVATVTIDVGAVNDAPVAQNQNVTTAEDVAKAITLVATDADSGSLTYSIVGNPTNGALGSLVGNAVTYTPNANFNGTDSFTFKANDGTSDSNVATVSITVSEVNDAPTAVTDAKSTAEDTALTFPASDLLGNDAKGPANESGQTLTVTSVQGAINGTVMLLGGNITFTPSTNYSGPASFSYTIADNGTTNGVLDAKEATGLVNVAITPVNDAPVAVNDSYSTPENTVLTRAAPGLLGNDTDVDTPAASLSAIKVSNPSKGVVTVNADGSFTYTPNTGETGGDTFTYKTNDGALDSNVATVAVDIGAANDPPVADNDAYSVNEEGTLDVAAPGVLDGDTDPDSATLTTVLVTATSNGTLTLNANGSFTYQPSPNFSGTDTFTYRASDGSLSSDIATVTITVDPVNDPPSVVDDTVSISEDSLLEIPALANDVDVDSDITIVSVQDPTNGTAEITNENTSIRYRPDLNYNGFETFEYTIEDMQGETATGSVTVLVTPVNDAPVANDQSVQVAEDGQAEITLTATDVEDGTLGFELVDGPSHGVLEFEGNGATYDPALNYNGADSFRFKVQDSEGLESTPATLAINVEPRNDSPIAEDQDVATVQNRPVTVTLRAGDVDGDELGFSVASQPESGDVSILGNRATYTPSGGFTGNDSFTFQVSDGHDGGTDVGIVNVEVVPAGGGDETFASIADVAISEADDEAVFTLALSNPANGARIHVETDDDTAKNPSDYFAAGTTYTFNGGATSHEFAVKLKDDTVDEDNERFRVNITVESGGVVATDAVAFGNIADDDPLVGVSASSVDVTEGNSGSTMVNVPLTLSAPSGKAVSIDFATGGGDAVDGVDYAPNAGTVTFAAGEVAKSIAVVVAGDESVELDETFSITLSNPTNANVLGGGTVRILNDDSLVPPPPPPPPPPAAPLVPTSDLALTMTGPALSAVDRAVTFDIGVRNNGPDTATGVVVTDTLPSGLQLVSASVGSVSCVGSQTVSCSVGTLASGATAAVTVVATTTEPGVHTNTASVAGQQADPAAGNNSASASTRVPVPVVREPTQATGGCTQRGTAGDDVLRGGPGVDVLCGLGGNDVLIGFEGNDRLVGGAGKDRLFGGRGSDNLKGGAGADTLMGGAGDDRLDGGRGPDTLAGERGNDTIFGSYGKDFLNGGKGKDRNLGGPGNDRMRRDAQDASLGGPGKDRCIRSGVITVCP